MAKHRAAEIEEIETCPADCDAKGFISCPAHLVEVDEDGWCLECCTPPDATDDEARVNCPNKWHD